MATKRIGISRDLIIHPGETIADVLDERGITQAELATRTGVTPAYVSNVIAGTKDLLLDNLDIPSNIIFLFEGGGAKRKLHVTHPCFIHNGIVITVANFNIPTAVNSKRDNNIVSRFLDLEIDSLPLSGSIN